MTEANGGGIVTAEDVATLNRATVTRAAAFVRLAGTALVVASVVFLAAWAWVTVRQQQQISGEVVYSGASDLEPDSGASAQQRIDVFTSSLVLLFDAALLAGVGLALRLLADHTVARVGGSLTGYEVGDVLADDEPDDEDDDRS
jgi:hypothetical protein